LPPKPRKKVAKSEYRILLRQYKQDLKRAKELNVQKRKECGEDFKRPAKPKWKRVTAILLPLVQYDIEAYRPSEFEKTVCTASRPINLSKHCRRLVSLLECSMSKK
jgi:hypothetical protein